MKDNTGDVARVTRVNKYGEVLEDMGRMQMKDLPSEDSVMVKMNLIKVEVDSKDKERAKIPANENKDKKEKNGNEKKGAKK